MLAALSLAGLIALVAPALARADSSRPVPRSPATSRNKRPARAANAGQQARASYGESARRRRGRGFRHTAHHGTHATRSRRDLHSKPAPAPSGAQSGAAGSPSAPTYQPSVCSAAAVTPTPENLETVREATMCLINDERITHGERPLQPNADLEACAQEHSESMANDDYFSHEGPDGSTPLSRMQAAGYIYSSNIGYEIGENIAWGTLWLATPKSIVESWMQSPEHRANILDSDYRETGIGVDPHAPAARAEGQPGALYTQDFGVVITG
jgi:uncharacterized protein YkwD